MEKILELTNKDGLRIYEDPTLASPNSAREMVNLMISDRKGIKRRPGVKLLGGFNTNADRCRGFFIHRKTDATTEIPIKKYDDELEAYSAGYEDWFRLDSGLTVATDMGFCHGFVRNSSIDYVYGGDRWENDWRWRGAMTQLNGALTGGETEVVVDSVLTDPVYYDGTAASATATTIDVAGTPWAASEWIDFYVYIKSGTHIDKIRKITANDTNTITFDTLGTTPGTCTFEIRMPAFPASGTIVYGGTEIAYTAISKYDEFTVASAHAGADNLPVAIVITEYPANPRGNRMEVLRGRRYIANVRKGMMRNAAGTLTGAVQEGAIFVSKVVDAVNNDSDLNDFTFADPRVAGEGDIISSGYGGEGHTDIVVQDDSIYAFKPHSIESIKYTQDTDDVSVIKNISSQYGSITRVIPAGDDVYFITSDKQFTSLGRVKQKAEKETQLNIGLPVKRLLEKYSYDATAQGILYQNRIHIPAKNSSDDNNTNRLLVFNLEGYFEGEWYLSIDQMRIYNNLLYASQSNCANVIQLYEGLNDVLGKSGDNDYAFPITSKYKSNWANPTSSSFNQQEMNLFLCEGYILGDTKLTFGLYKDLEINSFLSFDFQGTDDQADTNIESRFLGSLPLGIQPIGAISSEVDYDGNRHFAFMIYFPFEHAEFFSWGFDCSQLNADFDLIRVGYNPSEDSILDFANRIKEIT